MFKTIEWKNNSVVMIDQRLLPTEEIYLTYKSYKGVAKAIKDMVVRGAPAIGVAAAMGVALGAMKIRARDRRAFTREFKVICNELAATRPTAVNLFWAIERMKQVVRKAPRKTIKEIKELLVAEAISIHKLKTSISIEGWGRTALPSLRTAPPFSPTATRAPSPQQDTAPPWASYGRRLKMASAFMSTPMKPGHSCRGPG